MQYTCMCVLFQARQFVLQDLGFAASKGMAGAHQKLLAAQRTAKTDSVPNYYAVLGVEKSATPAAIRTAFRYLSEICQQLTAL